MKTTKMLLVVVLTLVLTACSSTKNTSNDALYDTKWELEYITGPRIAFDGLFPNKKPYLTFDKSSQMVQGNNSCNGYSAPFTVTGNTLTLGEPGPTTMMYCGEGEQVFVNTMKKINKYNIDADGKLVLMMDDVAMMRFHKTN
ncbi:META domain-containing protein [Subsaxibacter sp. CAU 1640]|uniref:META domain-containing protein n=1 Tax=Subsaxibacter sp. CAU 1640 TaxID=2933271 RepID=UPI0020049913|nr:META domain-containing protein [Subsaxibacter sp. CAU 1640]MCK7591457.1 META domain-containing protein [Subsaxibacter sp. CAU 1640]